MSNELLFITQVSVVTLGALGALWGGQLFLTALMTLYVIFANVLVTKEIMLCGLTVTASDALGIGAACCLTLLQEYYGVHVARRALFATVLASLWYVLLIYLHLAYVPAAHDCMHGPAQLLFGQAPRLLIASLLAYTIADWTDTVLLQRLKSWWGSGYFVLRAISALALTQLLDTIIFTYAGLWGVIGNPCEVIIFSYGVKLITLLCTAPLLGLSRLLGLPYESKQIT